MCVLWAVRASVHVPAAASALTLRTLPALASSITDLPGRCSSSLPHVVSAAALPTALAARSLLAAEDLEPGLQDVHRPSGKLDAESSAPQASRWLAGTDVSELHE